LNCISAICGSVKSFIAGSLFTLLPLPSHAPLQSSSSSFGFFSDLLNAGATLIGREP